jgi:hypothetical protein
MSQKLGFLSAIAVLLLAGSLVAEEPGSAVKHRLAYRFTPNQQVAYEVEQSSEFHNTLEKATEVAKNSAVFRRHYRVVSSEKDGSGDLETTIDRVHMDTKFFVNGELARQDIFKSDDPEFQDPKFGDVLAVVGKPTAIVKSSPAGRTQKVTPLGDVKPSTSNALGGTASPEGYLSLLPDEPVAVGDFWKERFDVRILEDKLPVKIEMLRTHKLVSVENGQATIEFRTTILTPLNDDPEKEMQLIQRETAGKVIFDLTQGIVISRESKVDRTVLNCFEGKGSMQAVTTYKERRIVDEVVANKPAETGKK